MKRKRRAARALLLVLSLLCSVLPAGTAAGASVIRWPKNAEVISEEMFYGNAEIEQAIIPEGVRRIESKAFADSFLREITLPDSLEFIADDAFLRSSLRIVHAKKGTYGYNWMREKGYLVEYRALLIGEKNFLSGEAADRNVGDVNAMQKMLQRVYGPTGSQYSVNKKTNLSYDQIEAQIQSTFADTMEQDVSLFFIATHGNEKNDGDLEMAFTGDPENEEDTESFVRWLPFDTLASWLSSYVQGKVIVLLESCGAGSAIFAGNNVTSMLYAGKSATLDGGEAFVERAVRAFAKADPGLPDVSEPSGAKGNGTGAMRQPKFYVLAAAAHGELSWGYLNNTEGKPVMNLFTIWLLDGIGKAGASPADLFPQDGILTLRELFEYINTNGKHNGETIQHVQCYPQDSGFECFVLK